MNRLEYMLTCAGEEAHEFGQRVCKAMRFGLCEVQPGQFDSNIERMIDELHDQIAVVAILQNEGHIPKSMQIMPTAKRIADKLAKIEKFMAISREQGTLEHTLTTSTGEGDGR